MDKVYLAFPCYDKKVDVEILMTVAQLAPIYQGTEFTIDFITSSIITLGRNTLVKRFLKTDCQWLYFWDADVIITDTSFLKKMLETASSLKADIVGCAYRIKHDRNLYAFGNYVDGTLTNFKVGDLSEPMLVDTVANGAMLISRKVFETLPAPWFSFIEKPDETVPEDHNFCNIARAAGFRVAIDPRIITDHVGYASWRHVPTPKEVVNSLG